MSNEAREMSSSARPARVNGRRNGGSIVTPVSVEPQEAASENQEENERPARRRETSAYGSSALSSSIPDSKEGEQ